MDIICGIYKITSPSGKVYVGQSVNIYLAFRNRYRNYACIGQPRIYNSLKKYGFENHLFEIIHQCKVDELNSLEVYYSELYKSTDKEFGLNIRQCGGSRGKQSEESKRLMSESSKRGFKENPLRGKRMSEINKGKIFTPETRKKISDTLTGRKHSQEWKDKMSKILKGRRLRGVGYKLSDEHKKQISVKHKGKIMPRDAVEKIRQANIGLKRSEETKQKLSEINKKIVLNLETGIFYFGAKEVAEQMGVSAMTASRRLNGRTINRTSFIYV